MPTDDTSEQLVRDLCAAFARRDLDELLGYFAEDAVYDNVPFGPVQGHDAIRAVLETFVPGSPEIEFEMVHLASNGPVVHTERIDRMTFDGTPVELPVAGVFEVADGKITAWRDYFDRQMFFGDGA